MMKLLKKFFVATVAVFSMFVANSALAENNPYQLMQQTADKLFGEIKADQSKIKQNPNHLRSLVRSHLMPYVNIEYAGQAVLGKAYSELNDAQKQAFFAAFDQFIEQNYAQALTYYTDQKIKIEDEKPLKENQKLVKVRVTIRQNAGVEPLQLEFKWIKNKQGDWKAYDMAVSGVSMVESKQKEWSGILRQQGIDVLTQKITETAKQPIILK